MRPFSYFITCATVLIVVCASLSYANSHGGHLRNGSRIGTGLDGGQTVAPSSIHRGVPDQVQPVRAVAGPGGEPGGDRGSPDGSFGGANSGGTGSSGNVSPEPSEDPDTVTALGADPSPAGQSSGQSSGQPASAGASGHVAPAAPGSAAQLQDPPVAAVEGPNLPVVPHPIVPIPIPPLNAPNPVLVPSPVLPDQGPPSGESPGSPTPAPANPRVQGGQSGNPEPGIQAPSAATPPLPAPGSSGAAGSAPAH